MKAYMDIMDFPIVHKVIAEAQEKIKEAINISVEISVSVKTRDVASKSGLLKKCIESSFGEKWEKVCCKSRKTEYVNARFTYCYLAKKHTPLSLSRISNDIGGRHHTTALNGFMKALAWKETKPYLWKELIECEKMYLDLITKKEAA